MSCSRPPAWPWPQFPPLLVEFHGRRRIVGQPDLGVAKCDDEGLRRWTLVLAFAAIGCERGASDKPDPVSEPEPETEPAVELVEAPEPPVWFGYPVEHWLPGPDGPRQRAAAA